VSFAQGAFDVLGGERSDGEPKAELESAARLSILSGTTEDCRISPVAGRDLDLATGAENRATLLDSSCHYC